MEYIQNTCLLNRFHKKTLRKSFSALFCWSLRPEWIWKLWNLLKLKTYDILKFTTACESMCNHCKPKNHRVHLSFKYCIKYVTMLSISFWMTFQTACLYLLNQNTLVMNIWICITCMIVHVFDCGLRECHLMWHMVINIRINSFFFKLKVCHQSVYKLTIFDMVEIECVHWIIWIFMDIGYGEFQFVDLFWHLSATSIIRHRESQSSYY